jgi:hypothetical protein
MSHLACLRILVMVKFVGSKSICLTMRFVRGEKMADSILKGKIGVSWFLMVSTSGSSGMVHLSCYFHSYAITKNCFMPAYASRKSLIAGIFELL